ncbi:hypothetical protein IW261DRAFT_1498709, partial [Armillaria novae-zelandiae]
TVIGCFLVSVTFYARISSLNLLLNRYIQLLIDVFTSLLMILTPILQARNKRPSWETCNSITVTLHHVVDATGQSWRFVAK